MFFFIFPSLLIYIFPLERPPFWNQSNQTVRCCLSFLKNKFFLFKRKYDFVGFLLGIDDVLLNFLMSFLLLRSRKYETKSSILSYSPRFSWNNSVCRAHKFSSRKSLQKMIKTVPVYLLLFFLPTSPYNTDNFSQQRLPPPPTFLPEFPPPFRIHSPESDLHNSPLFFFRWSNELCVYFFILSRQNKIMLFWIMQYTC